MSGAVWQGRAWRLGQMTAGLGIIGGAWTGGVLALALRDSAAANSALFVLICFVTVVTTMCLVKCLEREEWVDDQR